MTNRQRELVKDALSHCLVFDNNIAFTENYSKKDLEDIYIGFTEDLFSLNIPHYRVIGIKYDQTSRYTTSVVRKNPIFNESIIGLAENAALLVPIELGGNNKELGCYQYSDTPVKDSVGRKLDIFRGSAQIPKYKQAKLPMDFNPNEVGQMMFIINNEVLQDHSDDWIDLKSNNLFYEQTSISEAVENNRRPKFLLNNIKLADMNDTQGDASSEIVFFYYKGKKSLEYSQTADFFKYDSSVFPCRVTYDLGRFITVKYPTEGGNILKFYSPYGKNLDSYSLNKILTEYGQGLEV